MAKNNTQSMNSAQEEVTVEDKKNRLENSVRVDGYLRETTLEHKVVNGVDVIMGTLIAAISDRQSIPMRFYVSRVSKDGKRESKVYDNLVQLLRGSDGCVSIASLYESASKTHSNISYEDAIKVATKITLSGEMAEDVFIDKKTGKRASKQTIRGRFAAKSKRTDDFVPSDQFRVQGYVMSTSTNPDNGRVSIVLGVPAYNGTASRLTFITPAKDDKTPMLEGGVAGDNAEVAATAISTNYLQGMTVSVVGYVSHTRIFEKTAPAQVIPAEVASDPFFGAGRAPETQSHSSFVDENVVYAGDPAHLPLQEDEEGAIKGADIKKGLALKESALDDKAKAQVKAAAAAPASVAPAASAPAAKTPNPAGYAGFGPASAKAAPASAPKAPSAADVAAADNFDF